MPWAFRQVLTVQDLRRQRCQWDNYHTFAYCKGFLKFQKDVKALHIQCLSTQNVTTKILPVSLNLPQVSMNENKILKDPFQLTLSHCDSGSIYWGKVHEVLGKAIDPIHNSFIKHLIESWISLWCQGRITHDFGRWKKVINTFLNILHGEKKPPHDSSEENKLWQQKCL